MSHVPFVKPAVNGPPSPSNGLLIQLLNDTFYQRTMTIKTATSVAITMALHVRTALQDGISRVVTRNGLILIASYLVISLLQGGFVYAITTTVVPLGASTVPGASEAVGLTPGSQLPAPVSLQAAVLAMFTGGLLTIPVQVIAHRTFVSNRTTRIPDEFIFDRLGWATLNSFVGCWLVLLSFLLVAGITLRVGFWGLFTVASKATTTFLLGGWSGWILLIALGLLLLAPSIFLGMSLIFVGQEIAVRDRNVLGALVGSWRLTRGNRLSLLALAVIPMIPQTLVSFGIFIFLPPIPAQVVSLIGTGIVNIAIFGIMARAYIQAGDDGDTFSIRQTV